MTTEKMVRLLRDHGIEVVVMPKPEGPRVLTQEVWTTNTGTSNCEVHTQWLDTTDWTAKQLLDWLGY